MNIEKSLLSKENVVDFGILPNIQRLTVPKIRVQFGRKCWQKKRKDVDDKLLNEFFQKYLVVRERSAVENSFTK